MNASLLRLLHLSDPSLPIGGFSHSWGLETYVQQDLVHNEKTAQEFIIEMLSQNIQYTDAAFLSLSMDAAHYADTARIKQLDVICSATKIPMEIRMASQRLGNRLMKVFLDSKSDPIADAYSDAVASGEINGNYCIAFGIFANAMGIPKIEALTGFYYNAATGMVTNCVKLIPLSQQSGQTILLSLHNLINQLSEKSISPDPELIGWCNPGFDLRSMQHEQLHSRLYMS